MISSYILQLDFLGIFRNLNAFVTLVIMFGGFIGLVSKKLTMGAMGSFLVFVYIASRTELFIFKSMLYVILALIIVVMGLRGWSYANGGSTT